MTLYRAKAHGLTQRAETCLRNAGFEGELTPARVLRAYPKVLEDYPRPDLLKVPNLGRTTLREIRDWIRGADVPIPVRDDERAEWLAWITLWEG